MPEDHHIPDPEWSLRDRMWVAWDRAGVRWLVAILIAVVVLAGMLALRSRPVGSAAKSTIVRAGTPVPSPTGSSASLAAAGGPASPGASGDASAGATTSSGFALVHVVGPVRNPGVVTVPSGARVADAVAAAGGATKARVHINLARVVIDGEQIDVGAAADSPAAIGVGGSGSIGGSGSGSGGGAGGGGAGGGAAGGSRSSLTPGAKISLNRASASQLEELPRVGPVLASKIIEFRSEHGGFRTVEQLLEVPGIGDATFTQISPHVQL